MKRLNNPPEAIEDIAKDWIRSLKGRDQRSLSKLMSIVSEIDEETNPEYVRLTQTMRQTLSQVGEEVRDYKPIWMGPFGKINKLSPRTTALLLNLLLIYLKRKETVEVKEFYELTLGRAKEFLSGGEERIKKKARGLVEWYEHHITSNFYEWFGDFKYLIRYKSEKKKRLQ